MTDDIGIGELQRLLGGGIFYRLRAVGCTRRSVRGIRQGAPMRRGPRKVAIPEVTCLLDPDRSARRALRSVETTEVMASMAARKGRKKGYSGVEIDRFMASGLLALCEPYRRGEIAEVANELQAALARLEATREQLLEDGALRLVCAPEGESWTWSLVGQLSNPAEIEIAAWPVSVCEP